VRQNRRYYFYVQNTFSDAEFLGIVNAFAFWGNANNAVGTGTDFTRTDVIAEAQIIVLKGGSAGESGNASADVNPAAGPMDTGTIRYFSDVNPANPGDLYVRRIFLHEIGHLHALDDTPNVAAQSTVMLTMVPIGSLPQDVTVCDATRAMQKSVP